MTTITDEYMLQMRATAGVYSLVILKNGPKYHEPGARDIIWEHGRRNHALRLEGTLSIVCPIADNSEVAGIGIFNCSLEETKRIMDGDPAVQAGVLVYELHLCRGFPGDHLP